MSDQQEDPWYWANPIKGDTDAISVAKALVWPKEQIILSLILHDIGKPEGLRLNDLYEDEAGRIYEEAKETLVQAIRDQNEYTISEILKATKEVKKRGISPFSELDLWLIQTIKTWKRRYGCKPRINEIEKGADHHFSSSPSISTIKRRCHALGLYELIDTKPGPG